MSMQYDHLAVFDKSSQKKMSMSSAAMGSSRARNNFSERCSALPCPDPGAASVRPKSMAFDSPTSRSFEGNHRRRQSMISPISAIGDPRAEWPRRGSIRDNTHSPGTFAPQFIKSTEMQRLGESIGGIEGENDFSGKRYVWLRDPKAAFIKGWVVEERGNDRLLVQYEDGGQQEVDQNNVDKVNPAKFDKADDMAELTHLNEPSVVHNLQMRYQADLIYTYSGLFLVTVNPYRPLPIYTDEYMKLYRGRLREDTKPHIYAMADGAFRNLVEEGENQSILVT